MELTSQQALPVAQELAWEALHDVALLKIAIPGCESMSSVEAHRYELAFRAAVGPVRARFEGRMRLEDRQPPTSYTLYFEGEGGAAGHGKGHAAVRLEPNGPNETVLHYTAVATMGGEVGRIDPGLVDTVARRMAAEFFARFAEVLRDRNASGPPSESIAARMVAWLKQLVGR